MSVCEKNGEVRLFETREYIFMRKGDALVMYYKVELVESSGAPKIVASKSIDKNMHVKLFKNSAPVPLPAWFRHGTNCILKSKGSLENFPSLKITCSRFRTTCWKNFMRSGIINPRVVQNIPRNCSVSLSSCVTHQHLRTENFWNISRSLRWTS